MQKVKKYYRVEFDKKKYGYAHYVIDIEADNTKQAREIAEKMWLDHFVGIDVPHMFHVKVRKLKDEEEFLYHYFTDDLTDYFMRNYGSIVPHKQAKIDIVRRVSRNGQAD